MNMSAPRAALGGGQVGPDGMGSFLRRLVVLSGG
jgi:hypothetical protein